MKTKRIDFNFRPLQIDIGFEELGGIPNKQNYDAATGDYTPDYTAEGFALVIQPRVSIIDKDEVLQSGSVNHELTGIDWYVTENGVKTQILETNADYEMTKSGGNAGQIKVKRNVAANSCLTLEFNASYPDSRTGQVHSIKRVYPVFCDLTSGVPELFLDAAGQTLYNPLAADALQTVKASLKIGSGEVAAAQRIFVWEKYRLDGSWSAVGAEPALDYDVAISVDGTTATVDRSKMGTELHLRCRAKYDVYGSPSSVALSDSSPQSVISFIRRIPKFEFDISGMPTNIPELISIAPNAAIWDMNGPIADPERELQPLWFAAENRLSGDLVYRQAGHGVSPVLPTKFVTKLYGAVFGIDVLDRGPDCAWEDSDGKLFEDSDGKVILIK